MKRNFTIYLEGLDAKERKNVPQGKEDVLRQQDETDYIADAEGRCISTDVGEDARENNRVVPRDMNTKYNFNRPAVQQEEENKATLEKFGQARLHHHKRRLDPSTPCARCYSMSPAGHSRRRGTAIPGDSSLVQASLCSRLRRSEA